MLKLKKQFDEFHDSIRISDEAQDLKEKREILQNDIEKNFPVELEKEDIDVSKTQIEIFDQGSYHYHTTINTEPYDRDVAIAIPLDIDANDDPRKLKQILRDSLNKVSSRTVVIKEPCVTVSYCESGEEWMHIDLPLYAKVNKQYYLARGKEFADNYSWEEADPHGLNEKIDDSLKNNESLRRMVRFLKKWRDVQYANSTRDHEVPPSVGLTLLACELFTEVKDEGQHDDLAELMQIVQGIKNKFELMYDADGNITSAKIHKLLPVKPYTDVFQKMLDSSDDYGVKFYRRICTALENIKNAINADDDHQSSIYVRRVLGEEFELVDKDVKGNMDYSSRREHSFG